MNQIPRTHRHRAFTIKDLLVAATCLLLTAGMLFSLSGANRGLTQASVCAANLHTLFGGLMAYVNAYNSYPPNSPYPRWTTEVISKNGINSIIDPSIGWIMTYGLAMPPPDTYPSGHFKWFVLDQYSLPSVCVCPAADYNRLFTPNPEIDANNIESYVMQYAAFYQTSGTCRSATPIQRLRSGTPSEGGRNPPVADPALPFTSRIADNANGGLPYIWVWAKGSSDPYDPDDVGTERNCWVQAVRPAEVQDPGRVYYLADSRDYRPDSQPYSWPPAAISDGWLNSWGNKILMGTRHYGYANVLYLDGRVSRDNQAHPIPQWNMNYDSATGRALSDQWRCATFADPIHLANIGTQHHIMPVLMIKGWEWFFNADGAVPR